MSTRGYSGMNYDRQVENTNTSTFHKMKETYWTTKQAVIQKLGKKEDEHVVASDHELDSKLDVFRAVQKSSMDLLRVIERYQDRLCAVSQEENAMGRFLKAQTSHDKTRAGKMMAAVGKSQSFAAQQRLALRVPLVRLYQEVETFRYRAISDTLVTINRMEGARTEYRGALLWMKNISEELDPDTYKQLEKFRKVQGQVRKTKARFDKLKLDVMQKVDLLAASRCNMFSHVLANYQSTLLHFWEKTSRTMSAVAESFKGYQHYEFNMLKELAEPSKQLLEDTTKRHEEPQKDTDNDGFDPENVSGEESRSQEDDSVEDDEDEEDSVKRNESPLHFNPTHGPSCEVDRLLAFDDEYRDEDDNKENTTDENLKNLQVNKSSSEENNKNNPIKGRNSDFGPFIEFDEDEEQDDFSFSGKLLEKRIELKTESGPQDLLSEDFEQSDVEKDDMTLLNEILNAPSTGEDEFAQEWQAVFGSNPLHASPAMVPAEPDHSKTPAEFMPSSLLDISSHMSGLALTSGGTGQMPVATGPRLQQGIVAGMSLPPTGPGSQQMPKSKSQQPPSKKAQKSDMSAWFNLFADLDPLSDPDAVGRPDKESNAA
ncbi:islet cell autoantigen 1-like isoform X1 [Haliotis rufescens]|uniref:islet cell autoantigen 1-like isoform X1 n=1 Tax=Haliotis rufescens TaxID=6454 RepID=UPI001EB02BFF|nr:islet cell autoantigen 1-like isoform X1 [Haliotis rufescens]